ncbi:hypothetical protein AGLY_000330 [Aphis glycines]|uniref:C3H1-type domain-containing protein n=1 Tax=Aphis glycines TaxID=307491 RepID=A0A6G0U6P1_APHGL|nr:hypothetical protein AGLY_000330 [Aphis glycines]
MIDNIFNCFSNGNCYKNEINEDLEDGEIFDEEDDTEMDESTEQSTETKASRGRSRDRFSRNEGVTMKRCVSYQMDNDRCKRFRYDQNNKKEQLTLRNNQYGLFNRKTNNDTPMELIETVNDEEILYVRRTNSPEEFENEEEFHPLNNIDRRGRGKRVDGGSGAMDIRNRDMPIKQQLIASSGMKNKRSENEEKVCQYFLQGKCHKKNNCTYSHQQPNGRKMKLCKYYLMDCCNKEDRCTFMHSGLPCKYYHTGIKCNSGVNCRFSHTKLDKEQKKKLLKNNFEEEPKPLRSSKINFVSKNNKNKIPSLSEMQIPVPPELKNIDKNSDEDLGEVNNNNHNNNTPMPSCSRDEPTVDDTFKINNAEQVSIMFQNNRAIYKPKKYQKHIDSKERKKQEKEIKKTQRKERHTKKRIEKTQQHKEDLSMQTNDQPLLDDLNDDDEFNDLVIDKEKYQNEEKEQSSTNSPSKLNSSKVEQVHLNKITISDYMARLPNTIKACVNKTMIVNQPSPFHLPALEQPNNFEETIQEKKSIIEESPAIDSCPVELGKSDVNLRQLPFQFPFAVAREIDASLNSHPPMKYHLIPCQVSIPNYFKISPTMGIDDPRLRRNIIAAKDPMLIQNAPLTISAINVRPNDPYRKPISPKDP